MPSAQSNLFTDGGDNCYFEYVQWEAPHADLTLVTS